MNAAVAVNRVDAITRVDWSVILERAAAIVASYETGVTLRQLFYRLVASSRLPNTVNAYKGLSRVTAEARRQCSFPALLDRTRAIHRNASFTGVADARSWLADIYRRDRTEGQTAALYLGVEKNGLVEQLRAWFGDLGVPIVALGGYSSQTYVDTIIADTSADTRPAVLIYAGDFDASGEDIDRDFVARAGCFDQVIRIALTAEQVEHYALPPQPGKVTDSRAGAFERRHGRLVQVELDALAPDVLRELYADAIAEYWDVSAFDQVVALEAEDRAQLGAAH